MRFSYFKKLIFLWTIVFFALAMSFAVGQITVFAETVISPEQCVSLGYSYDFTKYSANEEMSDDWKSGVYEYSANMAIFDSRNCLTPAKDYQSVKEGYIVYNVKAGEGKVFNSLEIIFSGRVFHYEHSVNDGCCLRITASGSIEDLENNNADYYDYINAGNSGDSQVYTFDLTDGFNGKEECYVRFEFVGAGDWVFAEAISFVGTYRYLGYDLVTIDLADTDSQVFPRYTEIQVRDYEVNIHKTSGVEPYDVLAKISVTGPDGEESVVSANKLYLSETGEYKIVYTVTDENRVYENSYSVFCVNELISGYGIKTDGTWDMSRVFDTENYFYGGNDLFYGSGGNLAVNGRADYLLNLALNEPLTLKFKPSEGATSFNYEIALTPSPGGADFNLKSSVGLYISFRIENNQLIVGGTFSDGTSSYSLGIYGYYNYSNEPANISKAFAEHNLSIVPRSDKGVRIYFDGIEFNSSYCYSYVDCDVLLDDGNCYVSYNAVESGMEIIRLVQSDKQAPQVVSEGEFLPEVEVGSYYSLPAFRVIDEIDGEMPYTIEVKDTLYNNQIPVECVGGIWRFLAEVYCPYDVIITYSDLSGNAGSFSIPVNGKLKDGALIVDFYPEPEEVGRVGVPFYLYYPTLSVYKVIDGKEYYTDLPQTDEVIVEINITRPDGIIDVVEVETEYIPNKVGVYKVEYSVTNEAATTTKYYQVSVKLDIDAANTYSDILNPVNWVRNSNAIMTYANDGLTVYGDTYSEHQFDMEQGLEITMDLSALADHDNEIDCWVSLGVGYIPQDGSFGAPANGSLYFMLYMINGEYWVNGLVCNREGVVNTLFTESFGTSGTGVLSIARDNTFGESDNVNIYINNTKISNSEIRLFVSFDDITDDEAFSYLSVSAFGNGANPSTFKAVTFLEFNPADQVAPEISISGDMPSEVKIGETVMLPQIVIKDNLDPDFFSSVILFDPTGNTVDISAGSFIAQSAGSYILLIKAYDKSGNYVLEHYDIKVSDNKSSSGGCKASYAASNSENRSVSEGFLPAVIILSAAIVLKIIFSCCKKDCKGGKK